eukprot:2953784-Rhodomonas_salina.1
MSGTELAYAHPQGGPTHAAYRHPLLPGLPPHARPRTVRPRNVVEWLCLCASPAASLPALRHVQ